MPRDHGVSQGIIAVRIAAYDHLLAAERNAFLDRASQSQLFRLQQPAHTHFERSEKNAVFRTHLSPLDAIGRMPDGGSVRGMEVFQRQLSARIFDQPRVVPGNHGIVEDHVVVVSAADGDGPPCSRRSGAVRRAAGPVARPRHHGRGSQNDAVGRLDPFRLARREAPPVEPCAACRTQIFEREPLRILRQEAMSRRHFFVGDHYVADRFAAKHPNPDGLACGTHDSPPLSGARRVSEV